MAWVHLSEAAQNAACDAVVDLVDAGSAAGTIEIYDDTVPAPTSANDAVPGTSVLLVTLTFYDPAFTDADSGVATAGLITSGTAVADGTALWARVLDSDDNVVMDCDVGEASATLILNSTTIVTGGTVSVTAGTVTMPSGE